MNDFDGNGAKPCAFTYHLAHAAQEVEARVERALDEAGLSLAKMKLLRHLYNAREPLALGALAEKNACVKSNVTQLMDRMEGDGLVKRVPDPADRRSVRAQITAEGRRKYEAGSKRLAAAEAEVLAGFSDAEQERFREFLMRIRGLVVA
ncbi:MAG TPA: MarR family transcriptional regulator [Gemmatimonadales bacterium]|nr:MarR family transcriptional regulator [Gemmatimonadales bacterium]